MYLHKWSIVEFWPFKSLDGKAIIRVLLPWETRHCTMGQVLLLLFLCTYYSGEEYFLVFVSHFVCLSPLFSNFWTFALKKQFMFNAKNYFSLQSPWPSLLWLSHLCSLLPWATQLSSLARLVVASGLYISAGISKKRERAQNSSWTMTAALVRSLLDLKSLAISPLLQTVLKKLVT